MAKKSTETNIRKLTRMGRLSLGLTLPVDLVRSLGWREKQKVTVRKQGGALVVRDARTKK
jgi:antitoxin component of MazEF toxin-antitoxin module